MKKMHKVAAFLLPASLLISACTSKSDRTMAAAGSMLDSLRMVHAPDDRFVWWEMQLSEKDDVLVLEGDLSEREAFDGVAQALEKEFPEIRNELILLPEGETHRVVNGLVNNPVCHLRKEASSKTELITQALLGTPVRILKEGPGKVLVQLPDGYIGWTNASEVHALSTEDMEAYRSADKLIYRRQYGFAYTEPDRSSLPVSDLVLGNILPVEEKQGVFIRVGYPDGRKGWVPADEVSDANEVFFKVARKEDLVTTALPYHGVAYLWGGTSAKNIDCSGLVSNVYFMNGILLPRDADPQSHCGRLITETYSAEGLEVGDLLFFGRKATENKPESITHVGMYIGDGRFIHSAGWRDRVSINSMDPAGVDFIENYPEIFVRATRILGEEPEGFSTVAGNAFFKEIIRKDDEE